MVPCGMGDEMQVSSHLEPKTLRAMFLLLAVLLVGFFVLVALRLYTRHKFCMAHPAHASCLSAGG